MPVFLSPHFFLTGFFLLHEFSRFFVTLSRRPCFSTFQVALMPVFVLFSPFFFTFDPLNRCPFFTLYNPFLGVFTIGSALPAPQKRPSYCPRNCLFFSTPFTLSEGPCPLHVDRPIFSGPRKHENHRLSNWLCFFLRCHSRVSFTPKFRFLGRRTFYSGPLFPPFFFFCAPPLSPKTTFLSSAR